MKRKDKDDYWCAGAYIINKPVLKQFVDAIFVDLAALSSARNDSSSSRSRSRFSPGRGPGSSHGPGSGSGSGSASASLSRVAAVKVIAGYQSPCWPKFCCNGSALAVGKGSACVHAARSGRTLLFPLLTLTLSCARRGYQSDHFIYSLAYDETYMLVSY